jgi:hypothetical protein
MLQVIRHLSAPARELAVISGEKIFEDQPLVQEGNIRRHDAVAAHAQGDTPRREPAVIEGVSYVVGRNNQQSAPRDWAEINHLRKLPRTDHP